MKDGMQDSNFKILKISKDNLKFSSAHFLIFDAERAEKLHGHNYRVRADFKIKRESCEKAGYGLDFSVLKTIVKKRVDEWDEQVLIPVQSDFLRSSKKDHEWEIWYNQKRYVFPLEDVVALPAKNTSVEVLSELLAQKIGEEVAPLGVVGLRVEVEETVGQSAVSAWGDISL